PFPYTTLFRSPDDARGRRRKGEGPEPLEEGVRLRVAQDEDIVQRERDEPHEADEREAKRRSPSVPSQDDRRERHRAQWRHEQRAVTEPLRDRRDDPKG